MTNARAPNPADAPHPAKAFESPPFERSRALVAIVAPTRKRCQPFVIWSRKKATAPSAPLGIARQNSLDREPAGGRSSLNACKDQWDQTAFRDHHSPSQDPEIPLTDIVREARDWEPGPALSNSSGFGGQNTVLAFGPV